MLVPAVHAGTRARLVSVAPVLARLEEFFYADECL